MENQKNPTPLQLKLSLLRALKEGNMDKSQLILSQLASTTRTHPKLYQQFHQFVTEHKTEIKQIDREEQEHQQKVVIADGQLDQSWVTDDSVSLSSSDHEDEEKEQLINPSKLLKNIANSKSAAFFKPVKEAKRPFLIQTKPKENLISSTVNVRQSPSSKLIAQTKNLSTTNLKPNIPSRTSNKNSRPYFPPINASKPTLKL